MSDEFCTRAKVLKVDESLGLVFGWGIIENINGEPYFDTQGDHIPGDTIIKAATDFMLNSRATTDMHMEDDGGDVVFAFPLTAEVAKAYGIETQTTGLLVASKPAPEVLAKFKDGTYTGFSIGGHRVDEEVIEP